MAYDVLKDSFQMTLPQSFIQEIESYGFPRFSGLADALANTAPEVSVRFNPTKNSAGLPLADMVPWWHGGLYLSDRPSFTFDPALHQGGYYVQDASSMFIAYVAEFLADGDPVRWLDACAAPGGKTTAVIDALPHGSVVVANEFVHNRADVLRENLAKWGYPDVKVTNADTKIFRKYPALFDVVAADVPCSGEGMMRKDAEAVTQWSPGLVASCAQRQKEIIENLWGAVAPGGYFVYSTCTFNRTENEEMIQWMIENYGAEPMEIPVDPQWNISQGIDVDFPCYRFIPGITRGEGLFMAVLKKPDDAVCAPRIKNKAKPAKPLTLRENLSEWIIPDAKVEFIQEKERIVALSASPLAVTMPQELRPAFEIAVIKGKDLIPTQQLAMSQLLNRGRWIQAEVDRLTALKYLRCEAITLPENIKKGIVLLTHNGRALGFVKNLGNRANNLYPAEWRIRSNVPSVLPPLPFEA